jgi:uncharacterized repeat protein (TIGR03803 family)
MNFLKALFIGAGLAMLLPASAQTIYLTTIGSFDGTNGAQTRAGLVEGTNGNFYGVGYTGGANNLGTVFELAPGGPVTNLYKFTGGVFSADPRSPLLLGRDGYFYGEMVGGGAGYGYVFRLSHAGQLTNFASFDGFNGQTPLGGLMQGQDGNFYGTCQQTGGNGSVFKITPGGVISNLFGFTGTTNGSMPVAGLVQATNGVLYGTTQQGGTNGNNGTIFKITTNGVFTSLFSFNKTNGAIPYATMVLGPDGNLYGTTESGGTNAFNNSGTIFRITPAGQFTSLVSFGGVSPPGSTVYGGLVLGTNGLFYGMTQGGGDGYGGTIFQMDTNGTLTSLYSFNENDAFIYADGDFPEDTLVQGTDGNFYGTTTSGGAYNKGTVFSFSLTPPVASAPIFQSVSQLDGTLTFTWSAVSNASYQVQYNTNLTSTNWLNLGSSVTASNTIVSASESMTNSQCFYRIKLLQ